MSERLLISGAGIKVAADGGNASVDPDPMLRFTSSYHAFGAWKRLTVRMPYQSWGDSREVDYGEVFPAIPVSMIYYTPVDPASAGAVNASYTQVSISNTPRQYWILDYNGQAWAAVIIERSTSKILVRSKRGNPASDANVNVNIPNGWLVCFVRQTIIT